MLLLGAAKMGKSWFLTSVGKTALGMRKRVLEVTLEMSAEEKAQRYYHSIFSLSKRQTEIEVATMKFEYDRSKKDEHGNPEKYLTGFVQRKVVPEFTFQDPDLRMELEARVEHFGERFNNMIIKQFPTRSLTVDGLRGYMDNLEISEGFIPDILLLDYVGIMKTDPKNPRISLGHVVQDLRGLCVERNIAGVTVHQLSKAGALAMVAGGAHAAEDWSMIGTADQILAYSSTDAEHRAGLGRLYVDRARSEQDKFGCLLTQSYALGQFCIDSVFLPPEYWDIMPKEKTSESEEDDD